MSIALVTAFEASFIIPRSMTSTSRPISAVQDLIAEDKSVQQVEVDTDKLIIAITGVLDASD